MTAGLRWYLTSSALFLIPGGVQMVLFPYLVAVYLHESPTRVGIAQMAGQLPMLLLILFGGVVGDRVDQRRLLLFLQTVMMLPPLVIAGLESNGFLTYSVLIAWAIFGGTLGAFAQPARDALLNRIAGPEIQRVVILVIGVQFGIQIIGFAIGSQAATLGVVPVLFMQSFAMLCAMLATRRIPLAEPAVRTQPRQHPLRDIAEALRMAWQHEAIRPAVIQAFSVGLFFAGSYIVILPLMVRDLYHGTSVGIAMAFAANMLGSTTTIFVLMRLGGVQRPGRALLIGSMFSLSVLALLTQELSLVMFYVAIYLWGMCGGIGMTMSRSIVQEAAPDSHRARLLSVFSLGMMGGMPIGSFMLGACVDLLGPRQAVWVPVLGMLAITVLLRLFTRLWYVERNPPK
ncbi:MAG: MFS transporter [Pseudomonadales bacterium]|nr:MFS transporter [Pseudomonadales bacterium]MCP5183586.1 MFS transporter [Pseudomonadales bacterium]